MLVRAVGFEPTTYAAQVRRATRLRYALTLVDYMVQRHSFCKYFLYWQKPVKLPCSSGYIQ